MNNRFLELTEVTSSREPQPRWSMHDEESYYFKLHLTFEREINGAYSTRVYSLILNQGSGLPHTLSSLIGQLESIRDSEIPSETPQDQDT